MEKRFETIDRLQQVLDHLKQQFVGKNEIIDLMGICLAGRENLFLLGPPGTAKSAMVRELSKLIDGKTFEYLLTRFTEPNELFGPFDIRRLREGDLVTNTEGMLPEANLIFLDELLNANSAILNSLLMVLNERVFRRGRETKMLPAVMIVGASNQLPEDEALRALFDRFLLRVHCDNVEHTLLEGVLQAGWKLDAQNQADVPKIQATDISALQQSISSVDLTVIRPQYIQLIQMLRNAGVAVSDRRAVKLQRLIAASALLCKRDAAILSDLWVLRYIWDTEEQQEVIAGIVNSVIASSDSQKQAHPRASAQPAPDPEEIYKEVNSLAQKWADQQLPASERAVIKDRLRHLSGRSEWISNQTQREYVKAPIEKLWNEIIHSA